MEFTQHVGKTELARKTRQVIDAVRRGQTAIVETHGQPEVAIVDIIDYRILRAVMHYYAQRPEIDLEAGPSEEDVTQLPETQARYNLVLAHYLAGTISLTRAAELLQLPWLDLQTRCLRLDVPLQAGPADQAGAGVESHTEVSPQNNKQALTLLRAWQEKADDLGDEWWDSFEQDLKQHRFTLREAE